MKYQFDFAPGFQNHQLKNVDPHVIDRINQSQNCGFLNTPLAIEDHTEIEIVNEAVKYLKSLNIQFGDLRLGLDVFRRISLSDTNLNSNLNKESMGIGVRILYKGFWGFCATTDLSLSGVKSCIDKAYHLAKAVFETSPKELAIDFSLFAKEPIKEAEFHTPVGICPFTEPTQNLAQFFIESANQAFTIDGIKKIVSHLYIKGFRRIYADTLGSQIVTTHSIIEGSQKIIAVKNNNSAYRTIRTPGMAGGLEHLYHEMYKHKAVDFSKEAIAKCFAKTPSPSNYDLILDGHHLALTIHESVGHPTELDRVLGYEFGFAGGSFASLDKLNHFQYGSPLVNFTANNKIQYGLASRGFDDEGVEAQNTPIIRDGKLVGYSTNRETAHKIGMQRSNGNARSNTWADAPIVRIPNLYLEPGKDKLSLEDLISDTKNGILMLDRDSFSIDQMRYNFQFGADMCYRIENGKITEPLNNVIYQSISPDFWNSCDAICDESEWQMHGVVNCGKGQPMQIAQMTHGASPSRFKNIKVGY